MSHDTHRHPLSLKRIVYTLEGMTSVSVTRDVEYSSSDGGPLTLDVYRPPAISTPAPAAVIVTGYPDVGVPRPLGCAFKELELVVSLGQLFAVTGMAAIAYSTRNPAEDVNVVLDFLGTRGMDLGLDASRMGLWATSGHVPAALSVLIQRRPSLRSAVLSNGFMFDDSGSAVADAARAYRFANPVAGRSADDLPLDVPLFVIRSGQDEFPGVNETVDRFVAAALRRNLPITLVNHASAHHAFEIHEDSVASKLIIEQALQFMRVHLESGG